MVAHGIGASTVEELNETMGVEEFFGWAAYLSMEPFPEDRADYHVAMLLSQNYNMNRGKGKSVKRTEEFLPQWYRPEKAPKSPEEQKQVLRAWYLHWGGDPKKLT